MASLSPVLLNVHLLTMRGFLMQQQLVNALRHLCCTSDQCLLHVDEVVTALSSTQIGFEVRLYCHRTLQAAEPWSIGWDHEHYPEHTIYTAVFGEGTPIDEIVEAIRKILDTPLVQIHN